LNDAGPGSLRAALLTAGRRIVIFDVSGTISLATPIEIGDNGVTAYDFLTIAGQTAPSPGITVRGAPIIVRNRDVLIQHIRVRHGKNAYDNEDDILIHPPAARVVIDHVSTSWSTDENLNPVNSADVTISNCITSESLQSTIGAGGKGMLIAEGSVRNLVLKCLFAHNFDRNPLVKGGTDVVLVNNMIYNPGGLGRPMMGFWNNPTNEPPQEGIQRCSIIGNTAKLGPTGSGLQYEFDWSVLPGSQCYISDNNFADGFYFDPGDGGTGMVQVGAPPFALPAGLTIMPSSAVEAYIIANAGARPADRDAVDTRIINDVINRTGSSLITNESAVGGFPTLAQNTRALALPANPQGDDDGDGYTNLEELIQQLTACVEGKSSNVAQCRAWAVIP
jgi:pectate lyase